MAQQNSGGMPQQQEKHGDKDNHHQQNRKDSKGTQSSGMHGSEKGEQDVYFIIPRKVTVLHGPYMFQGMMDYRMERLQGLKSFLEKLGVTVELTPSVDHVNLCRIWFLDEPIFTCKMTDLIFGGDGEMDPVCWEAAESLENHIKKVLKGLKKQKPLMMTSEELKKPFCPCFQVDRGHHRPRKISVKSSMSGKSARSSYVSSRTLTETGERSNRGSQYSENPRGEKYDEEEENPEKRLSDISEKKQVPKK